MSTFLEMAEQWLREQVSTWDGQELTMDPADLADRRELFSRWVDSACVCLPRCFGGVSRLHRDFCEWEVHRGGAPSTRDTFERLLAERGFLIGEVAGVVLVSGLTFREAFEGYQ
jgi:hypothetical protein